METLLLLGLIALTAVAFRRLQRRLGDEWPPTIAPPVPARSAIETSLPAAAAPLPETEFALEASPRPAVPAAPATRPEPPAPRVSAAPIPLPDGPALRRTAWAMVAGGALLVVLDQWIGRLIPPGERLPPFLLFQLGGVFTLAGIQAFMRDALPGWFGRPLARLAAFLRVSPVQATLLLLAPCFAWAARLAAGDGLLARQAALAVLAWLLAVAFAVAGSAAREDDRRPVGDRWDWLFSLVLFAAALALRAYGTGRFPDTFSGDEGAAGLFAVELLTGKADNVLALGWYSFPTLYFTVQSAAIALLGQTVEAVRLTSAVAGALSVVALYWLARAMFDRTTAILAAVYLAASHYHIHMSRIALNNIWDGLFATLAVLGLWHGWQSGRRGSFILAGLAAGLGQYFYVSIRTLPVLFLIWGAAAFWRQRERFRQRLAGLALAAFIAFVTFMPLGLYFLEHPDEFQAPMQRVSIFGDWLDEQLALGQRTTGEIILDQAVKGVLGYTHEPLRLLYDPGAPLLLSAAGTLFLLGILWALLNFDLRYLLLVLPLLAAVASNAVSQDSPASQRYVMAMPFVALFVALPLSQAAAWLRTQYPRLRTAVGVAAFALLALVAAVDLDYYFNRAYDRYVLGGLNTRVATEVAYYLRDKEPPDQTVYFFGFPRMGYFSLSTIPFLAPEKRAQDVVEPLTGPPDFELSGPTLFVFLPERLGELELVRQQFPGGAVREFRGEDGELLFVVYER